MGRARLNKGTKKRVITSVERRIVCFSVGSPLQRHLPTTKWAVHPNPSAKLRNYETNTKSNRKNFSSHPNSFERHAKTSRRLAPKTRLLSHKNRDFLNKTPLLFSPTPHPTAISTRPHPLLPLYARIRALSEFSFFAFTLHHPQYLPHSWRVRGEGNTLKCLHPTKKFPAHPKRAKKHRERRPHFPLLAAFTLIFTLNTLYINPMQGTNFVF